MSDPVEANGNIPQRGTLIFLDPALLTAHRDACITVVGVIVISLFTVAFLYAPREYRDAAVRFVRQVAGSGEAQY